MAYSKQSAMVSAGGDLSSHRQFFGVVTLRIQLESYFDWTIVSASSLDSKALSVAPALVSGDATASKSFSWAISRSEVVGFSAERVEDVIGGNYSRPARATRCIQTLGWHKRHQLKQATWISKCFAKGKKNR
jgi:hypothetical protein